MNDELVKGSEEDISAALCLLYSNRRLRYAAGGLLILYDLRYACRAFAADNLVGGMGADASVVLVRPVLSTEPFIAKQ